MQNNKLMISNSNHSWLRQECSIFLQTSAWQLCQVSRKSWLCACPEASGVCLPSSSNFVHCEITKVHSKLTFCLLSALPHSSILDLPDRLRAVLLELCVVLLFCESIPHVRTVSAAGQSAWMCSTWLKALWLVGVQGCDSHRLYLHLNESRHLSVWVYLCSYKRPPSVVLDVEKMLPDLPKGS